MSIYYYKALNHACHTVRGKLYAMDEKDLEVKLTEIGLYLIDYHIPKEKRLFTRHKISTKDLISICIHIEQMEKVGLQLTSSLEELCNAVDVPIIKRIISGVCEDVKSGSVLSSALSKYPKVFDKLFVGLVAIGEKTGKLAEVFSYIADHLKWSLELKKKIRRAIAYPIFMLIIISIVMYTMTSTVIPAVETFLVDQEIILPTYTKVLVSTVNFFTSHWCAMLMTTIAQALFLYIAKKRFIIFNYYCSKVIISLPIIGELIRKIEISRFCRFFVLNYASGLSILESIDSAKNSVKNLVIKEAIISAKTSISNGKTLTFAMQVTNQFPRFVIHMFNIGEKSGNIVEAINNINTFYDVEVNDSINNLISVIKPLLIMILGLLVAWVTIAIFTPLYSSFDQLDL